MNEHQVYAMLQEAADKADISLQKLKIGRNRLFAGHIAVRNDSVTEDEIIDGVCLGRFFILDCGA